MYYYIWAVHNNSYKGEAYIETKTYIVGGATIIYCILLTCKRETGIVPVRADIVLSRYNARRTIVHNYPNQ